MTKVSVIVPVYNGEKHISNCIDSLINQTLKDIEIVIVDDGSTDNTKEVVKSYTDERIKYYYQENGRQGKARNNGIRKATGEYILYLDSDDTVDLNICKKMYDFAKEKDADLVLCDLEIIEDGKSRYFHCMEKYTDDIVKNYLLSNPGPGNKFVKRELLINNDLYFLEKHVYEDFAILPIYGLYTNKIAYLEEDLNKYVVRSGSTMNQKKYSNLLKDIFYAYDYLMDKYRQTDMLYDEEFEFIFIHHVFYSASFRFIPFEEGIEDLNKIHKMLKEKHPNWKKNKYYKMQSLKYKILSNLLYLKQYKLLRLLLRLK